MPKKVLVLAARGFLGEHVVQQLAEEGHEVLAACRPTPSPPECTGRICVLQGDCTDVAFLCSALNQADAVVFSAGRTWQPGLPIHEYQRQNVALTRAFFDALGHRPQMRVVFTSSLSTVGGSREPRIYAEDSGRDGILEDWLTPYDRAKIACEQIALDSARRGNNVIVLNPGLLLGPGVSATSNLAAPYYLLWFCQGQFTAKFYVNGGVTLSDVRDVAHAHVAALEQGRTGERYFLGGHHLDRREFYARVARLIGLAPPTALPAWFLYRLMSANDLAAYLTRGLIGSPVHRSFARTQSLYYYGASDKASAELGYTTRPVEATLLDMLHHYRARGLLPESLAYIKDVTVESAAAFVLLKQLVAGSGYGKYLISHLSAVYDACQANHELRAAFDRIQALSMFGEARGRFHWDSAQGRADGQTLRKFFEYVYFSSNEFLQKVL